MRSSHFFDREAAVAVLFVSRRRSLCSSDSLLRITAVSVRFLSRRCSLCSSDSLLRLIRFLAVLHLCLQLLDTRERFLSGIYVNMTEVK